MKMRAVVVAMVALAVCAISSWAQDKPGTVARIGVFKPKAGSVQQFEQARKKHFEFHRKNNDTWAWLTWQIVSGERSGEYYTGTFGHHWKDLDAWEKFAQGDTADANANMGPYLESESASYYVSLPEASRPTGDKEPPRMSQVTHYFVVVEHIENFTNALVTIKDALDKANYPVHSTWYRLVSGGEGPHFVLATARNSWADFEAPDKGLDRVLADVYGPQKATALLDTIRKSTRYIYSEILAYRPDLSYIPAAK